MYTVSVLAASTLLVTSLAQDIDTNDIPSACRAVCNPVHDVTQQCDNVIDGDNAYVRCVCQGRNINALLPACEACVAQNGDSDNDVLDLVSSCSLSTTTYNPYAYSTGAPTMGINGTSGSNTTVLTTTGSAGPMTITSTQPISSGGSQAESGSGGSSRGSGGGASGGSSSGNAGTAANSQTSNLAPVATGGAMAGLGVFAAAAVGIL